MLTDYIRAAMKHAEYEILEDGTFFGTIPGFEGAFANHANLEECRNELQSVLEDWILLGLQFGDPMPVVDGLTLALEKQEA